MNSLKIHFFLVSILFSVSLQSQIIVTPLPEKVVVLTFDDALSNHATFVAPLLKRYGFGATFFICEFPPKFDTDKASYMTWEQIETLNTKGFEIGNHTKTHAHVNKISSDSLIHELEIIEARCSEHSIPKPTSFAYPGYDTHANAEITLHKKGYTMARIGGNRTYNPERDHPLYIPSFSTSGSDSTKVFNFIRKASQNNIVVLTIHGVPDVPHPWVTTPSALFSAYITYLHKNNYTVLSLRQLSNYLDLEKAYNNNTIRTQDKQIKK